MVEVQESCKLNSETFCNQAHKRINNELEDIFTIMLRNSYPDHDIEILVNSASFLCCWYLWTCPTLARYKFTFC